MSSLQKNSTDNRAKFYRAVSGVIPGGSFIVEYLVDRIPEQRLDRLTKFVEELSQRLSKLEDYSFAADTNYQNLVENSLIEATRPISDKRLQWIAAITAPTEAPDLLEIQFRRKALDIVASLSDSEIEYLLVFDDWRKRDEYERSIQNSNHITRAEFDKLPSRELFKRILENKQLELQISSLIEAGLVEHNPDRIGNADSLSSTGKMLIYILSGFYPGKDT